MTTISFYTKSGSSGRWITIEWNKKEHESNMYLQLVENRRKWTPVVRSEINNKKLIKFISISEYNQLKEVGIPSLMNKSLKASKVTLAMEGPLGRVDTAPKEVRAEEAEEGMR
jgi:hypothetical protein